MKLKLMTYIAAIILTSTPALASVSVLENTKYYKFFESDPTNVIRKTKKSVSGVCTNSGHASACTKIKNTYKVGKIRKSGKLCKVKRFSIKLKVTYHLPKWKNVSLANPKIRDEWNKLYSNIVKHEKTHKEIHKKQFDKAYREILKLKVSCNTINNSIKSIINHYSKESIKENQKFDLKNKVNFRFFSK